MSGEPVWAWVAFMGFVAGILALDLGVFQRKGHVVGMREALGWCVVWASLAIAFGALVWGWRGRAPALEFYAGYLIEICLSVDNVFVFIVIFSFFKVPPAFQHRVLFWGIVGAAVMRFVFILAGVSLLSRFEWLMYVFGAFLVFTGIKMALPKKEEMNPENNLVVRGFRKVFPVTKRYYGSRFFWKGKTVWMATPLFVVLLVIETTDVAFAVDSIPAVLAITKDPFIVFTSNIFAIIGLRSLYFALNGVMQHLKYLGLGLSVILVFIGVKMLVAEFYHIEVEWSLGVIAGVLALTVVASLVAGRKKKVVEAPKDGRV